MDWGIVIKVLIVAILVFTLITGWLGFLDLLDIRKEKEDDDAQ